MTLLLVLIAIAAVSVVATVVVTSRDGLRRIPTLAR